MKNNWNRNFSRATIIMIAIITIIMYIIVPSTICHSRVIKRYMHLIILLDNSFLKIINSFIYIITIEPEELILLWITGFPDNTKSWFNSYIAYGLQIDRLTYWVIQVLQKIIQNRLRLMQIRPIKNIERKKSLIMLHPKTKTIL